MTSRVVEITTKGSSVKVPALEIDGHTIVVTGRWMKVAAIHDEEWIDDGLPDIHACVTKLKQHDAGDVRADIFTFAQKLPATAPLYSYLMDWESVAAIHLGSYEDWWNHAISGDARKDVRRAGKRGVRVEVVEFDDDLVKGIVEIYNEAPIRQGKAFWHYGKGFELVRREKATFRDRSVFLGAYYERELIGFTKIVYVRKTAAMMQVIAKTSHYDKRPVNALIAKAVQHCAAQGMAFLTYGRYRNRNKGISSLTRFKHRLGFEEILVPKFYVPLTAKGRMWLALGLHRDPLTVLPEWTIDGLYRVRTVWSRWRTRGRRSGDPGQRD